MLLTDLNLRDCNELTGKRLSRYGLFGVKQCCSKATPELSRMRNLLRSPHAPPPLVTPGDISALQSMLLTDLNLRNCNKLTGKCLSRTRAVWGKTVLPQGNT